LKNDGKYFSDETINKIKRRTFNKSFIRNKYIFKYNFKITEHQLVEYCLNNPFPGNSKWTANHPIWKCYVPGQPSPYIAWFNEKYLKKAVNNMFKTLDRCISESKEDSFVKRHLNAINSCVIENNKIVSSDKCK
jgi:hypothetical protein